MRWARTIGLSVSAMAVAGTLAGCEKPPPALTIWSGASSLNVPAQCWAFDAPKIDPKSCAGDLLDGSKADGLPTLSVAPGNTFGISVDESIAETGWIIRTQGQSVVPMPLHDTYFRLPYSTPTQPLVLQVVAGSDSDIKGVWLIKLEPPTGTN